MVEIEITKLSSKGQVVIPSSMRKNLKEGDKLIVIENNGQIVLKKASEADENFREDLEFARRTEEAYKKIESGEGISMEFDDFIKEMKKW
jgi:AbrB family looped-hinge helix DNA binding protein